MRDRLSKRPETSSSQFKTQVKELLDTLKGCSQHYIRCIKPNDTKRPRLIDAPQTTSQVTYLGLLENVRVRRAGYASRMKFSTFHAKYKV